MKLKFTFFISFFLFSDFCFAQDQKPKLIGLHGYIKDLQAFRFADNADSVDIDVLLHNRLNFKFNLSSSLKGKLEIRNRLFAGDQVKQVPDFGSYLGQKNELFDLSW